MFKKILAAISGFFSTEAPIFENALTQGVALVNVFKTFLGSATGETLQAIADALLPGIAPAIFTGLNTFFADFGLVAKDLTGSPAEIAAAGLNAISALSGKSKIYALSNLASIVVNEVDNANGGKSTPQQAIVTTPVAYNPSLLGSTVDTTPDAKQTNGASVLPND